MSETVSAGSGGGEAQQPSAAAVQAQSTENWETIENDSDFRELVHQKRNFIIPATIVFLVYYFGFLVLVGYFPSLVEVDILGHINIAYLFALSQFIVAWIIVYLYARRAGGFDKLTAAIVSKVRNWSREGSNG
ncbi:MAG: DUF485 domain-containing protein [Ktedonobacteraceae bacterium]|nr:DUF485 domain-containing protein [Ktedonobacteraceae bacterium]